MWSCLGLRVEGRKLTAVKRLQQRTALHGIVSQLIYIDDFAIFSPASLA